MWPFARRPDKNRLLGRRRLNICGMRFVIRKINPLLDFPADKLPSIFTVNRATPAHNNNPNILKKWQEDMAAVVQAVVVEPELVPVGKGEQRGKESGITVDDLFRDPEIGATLYREIIEHSLERFRGLSGLFFSTATRFLRWMRWRRDMDSARYPSFVPTVDIP